jgi:hypothetical protein
MSSLRRDRFLGKHPVKFCTIVLVLIIPFLSLRAIDHLSPATARNRAVANGTQQQAGQKIFRSAQPAASSMPHELAASYYSLRDHLNVTLILSNQGPRPFQVQATLFNLSGDRFDVPPIMLEGNKVSSFDLASWANLGGPGFQEGNLQVRYDGKDMELGGVLKLVDADHSLIFDEELSEPMMFASSRLEGVWWLPSNKCGMSLAVSNTTDSPVNAFLKIDGTGSSRNETETIELRGHQTRLFDLRELIDKKAGSLSPIGGIEIQHSGPEGAVIARGLIQDQSTGYSNVVEFVDPQTAKSSKLDGSGLRTADIGKEELQEVVVARNFSDSPTTLTGKVSMTQANGHTAFVSLPSVPLAAGETKSINLDGVINRDAARHATAAGLQFEYSSAPGSVVMSAQSVSKSENHVFRVPLVDAASLSSSTGEYPWSIDGSSSTFVYLKNATDKPQQYHLQVNFGDGVYSLGLKTIEPGQPIAFDLRTLRDHQVPDANGRTIPLDAAGGQVHWSIDGEEHLGLIGRVEQVDIAKGLSMTAACTECCPDSWYSFWIDPGTVSGFVGDSGQFTAMQQNITCYGEILDPFQRFPGNFTSTDPSVASCDSSGFAVALSPGTTNIGASWTVLFWDYDPIGHGGCTRYNETANPAATCNVGPHINSISPGRGLIGTTVPISIFGSGFSQTGSNSISVSGYGVTASDPNFINSGLLSATLSITADASAGNHALTVTTNGFNSNSVNFYVQIPTSLAVLSSGVATNVYANSLPNGCPPTTVGTAGPYGMQIFIRYQLMDQANPAQAIVATLPLREDLINFMLDGQPYPGDVDNGPVTPSGTTEADGTFTDIPVGACSPDPFTSATFEQDLFMSTNHTLNVRINNWALTGRSGCGNMNNGGLGVSVSVNCP